MKCPNDDATLLMSDKNGVEIDYCPDCRGVWLDRGELDKIIERADTSTGSKEPAPYQHRDNERRADYDGYHKKKKRESFLGDLFDF